MKKQKRKRKKIMKTRNFVAKHMNTVNRCSTHKDKKRDQQLGKTKHKGKQYE